LKKKLNAVAYYYFRRKGLCPHVSKKYLSKSRKKLLFETIYFSEDDNIDIYATASIIEEFFLDARAKQRKCTDCLL
jgi:hypothetical protein